MDLIKKHVDTVVILGGILSAVLWMNTKFNNIDKRFADVEREIAIMKTVMVMNKIMPNELAATGTE